MGSWSSGEEGGLMRPPLYAPNSTHAQSRLANMPDVPDAKTDGRNASTMATAYEAPTFCLIVGLARQARSQTTASSNDVAKHLKK